MADWATISSLATAGGTLVLAVATFSSVRSANRAARAAERSLLVGLRPVLIPSREDDPAERLGFGDGATVTVAGHRGVVELQGGALYMGMGVRNAGAGIAIIHGWRVTVMEQVPGAPMERPNPDDFHRQQLDLYIPAGDAGFWRGAIRDAEDSAHGPVCAALERDERILLDLLYGDAEGGQRAIARFSLTAREEDDGARDAGVLRYWNIDNDDPRGDGPVTGPAYNS
jgi:hypothetical protein